MSARKVAVVTGSNKGIGLAIVKQLCEQYDGDVYLTSRNVELGQAAVEQLKKDFNVEPKYHQLDINDTDSIHNLKNFLLEKYGGLDVLVNSAGIAYAIAAAEPFSEQAEKTIFTNYYSTQNACDILFPILKPHARVVNVASSVGMLSHIPSKENVVALSSPTLTKASLNSMVEQYLEDARAGRHLEKGWHASSYFASKAFLIALTRLQQKELDADPREDLVVNACHHGYVDTDLTAHKGPLKPEEGARSSVFLALLPAGKDAPRGQMFWRDCRQVDWVNDVLSFFD
ncbi:Carbonyl reductase [NADPH] 1 [Halotydeus destructor]|nr:Carbonyl reductase [NADPH] 1 [Halotydeus destructor]